MCKAIATVKLVSFMDPKQGGLRRSRSFIMPNNNTNTTGVVTLDQEQGHQEEGNGIDLGTHSLLSYHFNPSFDFLDSFDDDEDSENYSLFDEDHDEENYLRDFDACFDLNSVHSPISSHYGMDILTHDLDECFEGIL
jgi:hypothetical protein